MWLIFLLICNPVLFSSFFTLSSCALPNHNNASSHHLSTSPSSINLSNFHTNRSDYYIDNKKSVNLDESPISKPIVKVNNINKNKNGLPSEKGGGRGGSGLPVNEILSDDEDFPSGLPKSSVHSSTIEFSGDGPLESSSSHHNNIKDHSHIVTKPGHTDIVSINKNKKVHPSKEYDEEHNLEDDEDGEDEDEDYDGSGDSSPSSHKEDGPDFTFSTKETIDKDEDDAEDEKTSDGSKPDSTGIHTDSSEDKGIVIDSFDKTSDSFFPDVSESSTKRPVKPPFGIDPDQDEDGDEDDEETDEIESEENENDLHPGEDRNTQRTDISVHGSNPDHSRSVSFFAQPILLAAIIGGTVVSLLCAILLAMFVIYRTRRKDEEGYICQPSLTSPVISHYGKVSNKFYDP